MKIDLIGMILNNKKHGLFEGLIIDEKVKKLDTIQSLNQMIMDYATVKNGGTSEIVSVHNLD